jgi:hypothetical protein
VQLKKFPKWEWAYGRRESAAARPSVRLSPRHLSIDCAVTVQPVTVQKTDHPGSGDPCDSFRLNLYTLGYQGVDVDTYVQKLKTAGVGIVADVRETPWSHKRGFCKNALSSELSKVGIEYVHVRSAGNPKENRRSAPDLAECLRRYKHYLAENPAGVDELLEVVRAAAAHNRTVCLTCFEKDVHDCHRGILVNAMEKQIKIRPVHL